MVVPRDDLAPRRHWPEMRAPLQNALLATRFGNLRLHAVVIDMCLADGARDKVMLETIYDLAAEEYAQVGKILRVQWFRFEVTGGLGGKD